MMRTDFATSRPCEIHGAWGLPEDAGRPNRSTRDGFVYFSCFFGWERGASKWERGGGKLDVFVV